MNNNTIPTDTPPDPISANAFLIKPKEGAMKALKVIKSDLKANGCHWHTAAGAWSCPARAKRKNTIKMYPVSQMELSRIENRAQTQAHLETRLIYGSYPEVILNESENGKKEYLRELISSYLMKDILIFEGIKNGPFNSEVRQKD